MEAGLLIKIDNVRNINRVVLGYVIICKKNRNWLRGEIWVKDMNEDKEI